MDTGIKFSRFVLPVLLTVVLAAGCYPGVAPPVDVEGIQRVGSTPTAFFSIIPLTGEEGTQEGPTPDAYGTSIETTSPEVPPPEAPSETPIPSPTETQVPSSPSEEILLSITETPTPTNVQDVPQDNGSIKLPALASASQLGQPNSDAAAITLPWIGDLETGDISQWQTYGDWISQADTSSYQVVTSPVHSGRYAVGLTIDTSTYSDTGAYASYLFLWNQNLLAGDNYYSAWYYIPSNVQPQEWWSIWQWKSTYNGNTDYSVRVFAIGIRSTRTGPELVLSRRPSSSSETSENNIVYYQTVKKIPTDTWFQIKAYYKRAIDNTGQVIVWQDDTMLYDIQGVNTVFADNTLYWSIHNYTNYIEPNPVTIFIDDVRIERSPQVLPTTTPVPTSTPTATSSPTTQPVLLAAPIPVSPVIQSGLKPLYRWTAVSGATSYDLFTTGGGSGNYQSSAICVLDVCSVRSPDNLSTGNAYNWYIVPRNSSGVGTASNSMSFTAKSQVNRITVGDFDGDSSTDIGVFRSATTNWSIYAIGAYSHGSITDIPVPGDYNGDGKNELAVFSPSTGTWKIKDLYTITGWGVSGDYAVPADYDGDGMTDIAYFRPSTAVWSIFGIGTFNYGSSGDIPVPGHYNNDNITDLAVFRPSTASWNIQSIGSYQYGASGDKPVPADYTGDGLFDLAVWRPSTANWYINGVGSFKWGSKTDQTVPGDYDGDGKTEIGYWEPSSATWYVKDLGSMVWGASTDRPLSLPYADWK